MLEIAGEIDRRHAPVSEFALEHVTVLESVSQG
jgi:hypothetical protein